MRGDPVQASVISSPVPLDAQYEVVFEGSGPSSMFADTPDALRRWRADTLADEQRAAERPGDPSAPWSGDRWSTPIHVGLPKTTRAFEGTGPVGLTLVEDRMGWTAATSRPLRAPDTRVFEINDPADRADLTTRYSLEVSRSRLHDWWRVTGRAGTWVLPKYPAAAGDYDAIHLSVFGYLATAGRSMPVGSAATLLAGWDPDLTSWLTAAEIAAPATRWTASDQDPLAWHPH